MLRKLPSSARASARALAVLACVAAVVGAMGTPAQAYVEDVIGTYNATPWMQYDKNPDAPLDSTLTAYVSVNGNRYRIVQRAGSGNGSTESCEVGKGWLPNGTYGDAYDSGTMMSHYNKTWGNEVVRGWVWQIGDHKCHDGTWRTELFIHSQGTSGWSTANYASNGCIKINQTNRSHLHARWDAAWHEGSGYLEVIS